MTRATALYIGVGLLAVFGGLIASAWQQQRQTDSAAADHLLTAPLSDLQGHPQTLAQYRGKVLVVNFWATWCPPCREEIPHFVEMQGILAAKGVQFIGIALDTPEQIGPFLSEMNINYPVFVGGISESELMRQLGNHGGGLPYTLVYNRQGELHEKIIGGLDKTRLERLLAPYI